MQLVQSALTAYILSTGGVYEKLFPEEIKNESND